ncbi:hypothetical protein, partial [Heliobacterium chlorum]|uniref:hypothetical protein n=1 Tax=Heliobacterium chlorum TaxID=2698 RepID=UPI001A9A763F
SLKAWLLLLLNISLILAGQTLIRLELDRLGGFEFANVLKAATSPGILGGVVLLTLALPVWFKLLTMVPFSTAFPAQGLIHFLGIIVGWLVFSEYVPTIRWIGGLFLMVGAYLVSLQG